MHRVPHVFITAANQSNKRVNDNALFINSTGSTTTKCINTVSAIPTTTVTTLPPKASSGTDLTIMTVSIGSTSLPIGRKTIDLVLLVLRRLSLRPVPELPEFGVHSAQVAVEVLGPASPLPFGWGSRERSSEEHVEVLALVERGAGREAAEGCILVVEGGFGKAALEGVEVGFEAGEVTRNEGVFWGVVVTWPESQGERCQSQGGKE